MLSSLNVATDGLLKQGNLKTLNIAIEGLLRTVVVEPPFEAVLPVRTYGTGAHPHRIDKDYKPKKLKELLEDDELMELAADIIMSGILE